MRIFDPSYVLDLKPFLPIEGFYPVSFILDEDNVVLRDGLDYAVFEYTTFGVYTGHYFFSSRGREAIDVGEKFLAEIKELGAKLIIGYTPVDNKPAKFMNRKLGFSYVSTIDTSEGPHEMYIRTLA